MYEAARTRSVDSRVDKTKRGIEGLSYPVSRISGERGVHGEALCQVSSRLVVVVGPFLTKQETHMRTSIAPNERIALGIRYLVTGETFQSLSFQYRIGKSTVSQIVMKVCDAIYQVLGRQHLKTPNTVENWRELNCNFILL